MKLFVTGILASAMLWAQAPAGDIVGVGNFSHIVQNLDKSLEFYRDVLGLEVAVNQPFAPNAAIAKLGNTLGGQSRYAALKVPGSEIGVELIEYKDIERKPQHPHFYDPGAANMALRVRDLDSAFAKLQKFGATVITAAGKPVTINNTIHVVFVQDPDGFVVELGQGTPPTDSKVPASSNVFGGSFELSVVNSEESVKFYNDLLGFNMKLGAEFNTNKLMAETAGAPGASFRQSRAMIPGTSVPMTLIEFKDIARKALKGRVQDPGTAILQLRVHDVVALTEKLKAAGVPVVTTGGEPVEVGPGLKIAIVRDPNNLMLELLQAPAK
jgi:catechol 2,3-dioxygenase-like lactoylglutathione lyase family enzyme